MVLLEAGVSRRHARLFTEAGRVRIEDLGSANGTFVNGEPLEGQRTLRPGDELGVGSVLLTYSVPEPSVETSATHIVGEQDEEASVSQTAPIPAGARDAEPDEEHSEVTEAPGLLAAEVPGGSGAQRTWSGEVAELQTGPVRGARPVAAAAGDEAAPLERLQTRMLELPLAVREASLQRKLRSGTGDGEPRALARSTSARPVLAAVRTPREQPRRGAAQQLGAVERSRLRRELGDTIGGQLRLWWMDLGTGARRATALGAVALLALVGASLWFVFRPEPGSGSAELGPEPVVLGSAPLAASFGVGSGVTWEAVEQKAFTFEFVAPTRAVALLHFEASELSTGELAIVLNGEELGEVEGDAAELPEREHEWVLPISRLRKGEPNQVIFDSRLNPPARESWRIAQPWVEIIPVPELDPKALLASAREHARRGNEFLETRQVGSDNLFKAWKAYRAAWITLEAMPEHPPLYTEVRFRMTQLKGELDTLCGTLILDFQRALELNQRKKARTALQDVLRHFPTSEHRCHNLARVRSSEHAL